MGQILGKQGLVFLVLHQVVGKGSLDMGYLLSWAGGVICDSGMEFSIPQAYLGANGTMQCRGHSLHTTC